MASCKKFVLIMYEIYDWNKASFDIHENDYGGATYNSRKWSFITDLLS